MQKISLVLKGSFTNSGRKKLWNGKGAPVGQCLADIGDDGVLVLFKAQEVIDAMRKQECDRT
ncbi:MAG: hypothetical protein KME45_02895 [Stenomitos rutilans HA7619-LM2]|jgi:hypothetical protein|nr:hypothetical protein [Stenomitos rutilans HA7619-LM2]MBW4469331.1 hypothetical protein [Stenomitos rutilans HA7619-LM2]